jgi:hypothetical protein
VERHAFDSRWRYAAGVGGYDGEGRPSFAHTVLVDMRARLAASEDPRRTRPKIERKIGHLMRRKHGGGRARVRGRRNVDADFNLLAAAGNLARLAALGLHTTSGGWAVTAAPS